VRARRCSAGGGKKSKSRMKIRKRIKRKSRSKRRIGGRA
jgi:hypothetical protein